MHLQKLIDQCRLYNTRWLTLANSFLLSLYFLVLKDYSI